MAEMVKLLNGVVPLGKIKRLGKLYCGSGCGRGCTWAECQKAIVQANRLLKRLGKGWKPRVWENLGWHYEAVSRDATIRPPSTPSPPRRACACHVQFTRTPQTSTERRGKATRRAIWRAFGWALLLAVDAAIVVGLWSLVRACR